MMIKTFEDLDCWKLAAELRRAISTLVKNFPKGERYLLTDQLRRASRSVTANIAEGYGRYHYQEYIQYGRQSRGSLYEIIDHLLVAQEENYITQNHFQNLRGQVIKCVIVLNGFINYLDRAKTKWNQVNDPEVRYDITIHD